VSKVLLISIVDDDRSFRRAAAGLVESLGYAAAAFGSAEEFLKSGQLDDTACLICDVHMPGMSGIELQDRLLAGGYRIPVVFITAYSDAKARAQALAAGALGFLDKPFGEQELIACLDRARSARNA
jgi:FixJ family two-component response regulator